ncbi:hypothetical protein [Mobilicoccus pelagius]|uniref:Uncharacterized protein n=1 Tax=Mobilicoccus pelagius NBRC 104925 TaxID=1089455 RepID=H5UQU5_9MICO|nr:hypothetical protein [Mobilicoccus pelagius]GAB48103.1 hypothetical protein MOPEL_060_00190 [Mobilicoccus pelagius NBRC 104925]
MLHTYGRTLATVVALGLAGAGLATPATAATTTPKPKTVTIKPTQYPRLIDNPGANKDVIRFTNVPGASWSLDGVTVQFDAGRSTADRKVTVKSQATLVATTGDTTPYTLAPGTPGAWNFPGPTADEAAPVDGTTVVVTWNDLPGDKRDTVTLTKVSGVTYTVDTDGDTATTNDIRVLDADAFGTKAALTVPATSETTVTPSLAEGYKADPLKLLPGTFTSTVTASAEVALTKATLDALISVGENPLDATKGYGPGSAVETVKVLGVPGVKFKVGSRKAVAVNGVGYLPVDPDDIPAGKVTVTVQAGKGYTAPADYSKSLDFTDGTTAPTAVVTDADVKAQDKGGISADNLTIKASQGMTWWVGQADKTGKIKFAAQKPGKNGVITYKAKHASKPTTPDEKATVHVKAVANRGWLVDTTNLKTTEYEFKRDATVIAADNRVVSGTDVTFHPYEGISAWNVTYTTKVGTKTAAKRLAVKPIDITNTGATTMTIPFADATDLKAEPKVMKDYTAATQ